MNVLRDKINLGVGNLHLLSAMWLVATLMFPFHYQRPALYAFAITYIADYVLDQRWQNFTWDKSKWLYVAMIAFYLLIPIWNLWADTSDVTQHYIFTLERRMPFLAFGVIGILGISSHLKLKYICYAMIFSAFLGIAYVLHYVGVSEYLTSPDRFQRFAAERIEHLYPHMTFNIYLNYSLLSVFYLFMIESKNKIRFVLLCLAEVTLLFMLLTTDGRTGFITAIMLHTMFLLYGVWIWKRRLFVISVVLLAAFCVLVASTHQRISLKSVTSDARYPIWNVATQLIAEKPIVGHGVKDARIEFVERGQNDETFVTRYMNGLLSSKYYDGNIMVMHPHNIFLDVLLEFGVIGLGLLIFILLYPLLIARSYQRIYVFLFTLIFFMQSLFEVLGPHCSPLFYSFGLVLWLQGTFDKKSKQVLREKQPYVG